MTLGLPERGAATRLVLVRHAETDEAMRGRCYGRLDVPLSAEGRRQAAALGLALADTGLAAVYSSPLRRALDTAAPIAAAHGLEPVPCDGLRELDFGELEGLPYEEIRAARAELFQEWMEHPTRVRFPGGEAFADLRARVLETAGRLRDAHRDEAFALVAHGGVARVVLAEALGLPADALFRVGQGYGGVSVVDWSGEEPVVQVVNAVLYSRG